MATIEERVDFLERAIQHMPTLSQVEALVKNQGIDATAMLSRLTKLEADLGKALGDIQSMKLELEDHETRITILEG